jgi:MFS family permease
MNLPQLPDITHVIQLAVAPVFLLAGVGAIINVLAGRLARVIDRARAIETQVESGGAGAAHLLAQLPLLARRARWVSIAMALAVTCALLVSLMIALAFLDEPGAAGGDPVRAGDVRVQRRTACLPARDYAGERQPALRNTGGGAQHRQVEIGLS